MKVPAFLLFRLSAGCQSFQTPGGLGLNSLCVTDLLFQEVVPCILPLTYPVLVFSIGLVSLRQINHIKMMAFEDTCASLIMDEDLEPNETLIALASLLFDYMTRINGVSYHYGLQEAAALFQKYETIDFPVEIGSAQSAHCREQKSVGNRLAETSLATIFNIIMGRMIVAR